MLRLFHQEERRNIMDKKVYNRAMLGQYWYNSTEVLAYALLYRKTPDELTYLPRVHYGEGKYEYINIFDIKKLRLINLL